MALLKTNWFKSKTRKTTPNYQQKSSLPNSTPKFVYKKSSVKKQRQKVSRKGLSRKAQIEFKKIVLVLLVTLGVVAIGYAIYWSINQLKVKQIDCRIQYQACPREINDWLQNYDQQSLIRVWLTIADKIKDQFATITNVQIAILGTNHLLLDLDIDPEIGSVTTMRLQTQDEYYLVTESGLLTKLTNQPKLPIVVLEQLNTPIKNVLPDNQAKAIKIARALDYQGYKFRATQFEESSLEIEIASGLSIIMPLNNNKTAEDLVSALQLILSQATIEVNRDQIDLRYNQPVIRDLTVTIIPTPTATASADLNSEE